MSAVDVVPPAPAFPEPVRVRRMQADAEAARRLARGYRRAADQVDATARELRRTVLGLDTGWRGRAAAARWQPVSVLLADLQQVGVGLREAAAALDRFARELDRAHEHHGWSLKKLAVLGAVVVVTAAAVTVTMGAAAVAVGTAEAAAASSALAGAGAAVAAASAAEATAATSLLTSAGLLTGIRALAAFALPKLAQGELAGGVSAFMQELHGGSISASAVLLDAQLGLVGAGAAGAGLRLVRAAELEGALGAAAPHLVVGAAAGGTSALAQWEHNGSVDVLRAARDGAFAGYFSAVGAAISRNAATAGAPSIAVRTPDPTLLAQRFNWTSRDGLVGHWLDHGKNVGARSLDQYAARSRAFIDRVMGGSPVRMRWDSSKQVIRAFDERTGEFAVFNTSGVAITYYVPRKGLDYFLTQPGRDISVADGVVFGRRTS